MNGLKAILLIALSAACVFDGAMTLLGVSALIGSETQLAYVVSGVVALLVLALSLNTTRIFWGEVQGKAFLILLWLVAIPFDFYTTLVGHFSYFALDKPFGKAVVINLGKIFEVFVLDPQRAILLTVITCFVASSPIVLSNIIGAQEKAKAE